MTEANGSLNGHPVTNEAVVGKFVRFILNQSNPFLTPRFGGASSADTDSRRHDVDGECGYPDDEELTACFYKEVYERWGLAARVNDIWPDECWAATPDVYENDKPGDSTWDQAVRDLDLKVQLWHYLHRLDRLAGLGRFAVLFLGLDDGGRLDRAPPGIDGVTGLPVEGQSPKHKLVYARAFDETQVQVEATDNRVRSPRFGQPTLYTVQFPQPPLGTSTPQNPVNAGAKVVRQARVHWTRVRHVFDNPGTSEVYGKPRLRVVMNLLHDLRKVCGGSAEMFWKTGFPGYAFETNPGVLGSGDLDVDVESMRKVMRQFQAGLERFLYGENGSWKTLMQQVADPSPNLEWIVKCICCAINVPARIFMGSEAGQLASTKDDDAWRTRCSRRQTKFMEPRIVRPVIDHLMNLGCLPRTKSYNLAWRDLRAMADKDRADVVLKRTQAITNYVTGRGQEVVPHRLYLTRVADFSEAEADVILAELKKNPPPPPVAATIQGGSGAGRTGKAFRGDVGRPAGKKPGDNTKGAGRPATSAKGP